MLENDFEKQVQQKMGAFDLPPSPEVWSAVELRIRKEKKRRLLFFWMLGLLFAGAIGMAILSENKSRIAKSIKQDDKQNSESIKANASKKTTEPFNLEQEEPAVIPPEPSKPFTQMPNASKPNDHYKSTVSKKKVKLDKKINAATRDVIASREEIKPGNEIKQPLKQENADPGPLKNVIKTVDSIIGKEPVPLTVFQDQSPVEQKHVDSIDTSIKSVLVDNKKIITWNWGVAVSAGKSNLMKGFSPFGSKMNMDQLFASPSSPQVAVYRPESSSSLSLTAGAFMKRSISQKLDLIIAADYQYFSSRIMAGVRIDSTKVINNRYTHNLTIYSYYQPLVTADYGHYKNDFHFVGLSGEVSWRLTSGKKFELRFNNGLSYQCLLASTMLHYDHTLRGYYQDGNRMVRNQVFFNTAIELPLSKKISLSPMANFSLFNAVKADDSLQRRYKNFGLRLRYSFNNK